jgi:imidazolonepropionase-like amidohydrolase
MAFQQRFHLCPAGNPLKHDAGTIAPARSLGMERDIGSLEVGQLADLVVLTADPSADIRNSDKIAQVMLGRRL